MILIDNHLSLAPSANNSNATHQDHHLQVESIFDNPNFQITGHDSITFSETAKTISLQIHVDQGTQSTIPSTVLLTNFPLMAATWDVTITYNSTDPNVPNKTKTKTVQTSGTSEPKPLKVH